MRPALHAATALVVATAAAGWWHAPDSAEGQTLDPSRPRTLVVGSPAGARSERVDGARTGFARTRLPVSALRVEWRTSAGTAIEQAPVVDARETAYVVGARGDVVAFAQGGAELWRVPTGGIDPGPLALLSDDTLVFVDAAGEAIGVRDGTLLWRSRFARPASDASAFPSPIPLEDGGAIVATSRELAVIDADGRERSRTTLRDPATSLVAVPGAVIAVDRTGGVFSWALGAADPVRVGAFGSPIVGGAALADEHTLVAVAAGGATLASVDLVHGTLGNVVTRSLATGGTWLGPPAMRGENATLLLVGGGGGSASFTGSTPGAPSGNELAVTVDAAGREVARALLASHPAPARADGGAPLPEGPHPRAALLVDAAGTVAFVTLGGDAGAASSTGDGAVEILSDVCPRSIASTGEPAAAGVAPLGPGTFLVACRGGSVVAIGSASGADSGKKAL
jgi:hypothetical protein